MRYQHTTKLFRMHLVFRSCSDLSTEPHGIKASRSRCQKMVSPGCQHQSWRNNFQITTKYALLGICSNCSGEHIIFISSFPKSLATWEWQLSTWVSRLANPTLTSIPLVACAVARKMLSTCALPRLKNGGR